MRIIFLLITLFFVNCSLSVSSDEKRVKKGNYNIVVIDSCEYIEFDCGYLENRVYTLTHKGNCKYCAERRKSLTLQELK